MSTIEEKRRLREEKIASVRRRRRLRLIVLLILVIVLVLGIILAYNSQWFQIKEIKTIGNKNLSNKEVVTLSRVTPGASLLRIPLRDIKERLKKNPWVKEVQIDKDYPDKLIIRVIERKPVALVEAESGQRYLLVDADNFIITSISDVSKSKLPVIQEIETSGKEVGETLSSKNLSNAIKAYQSLYPSLKKSITIIRAVSPDELYFYVEGIEILYGEAKDIEKKNRVLKDFLSKKDERIIFIDVRVPSHPVKRPLE